MSVVRHPNLGVPENNMVLRAGRSRIEFVTICFNFTPFLFQRGLNGLSSLFSCDNYHRIVYVLMAFDKIVFLVDWSGMSRLTHFVVRDSIELTYLIILSGLLE